MKNIDFFSLIIKAGLILISLAIVGFFAVMADTFLNNKLHGTYQAVIIGMEYKPKTGGTHTIYNADGSTSVMDDTQSETYSVVTKSVMGVEKIRTEMDYFYQHKINDTVTVKVKTGRIFGQIKLEL